MRGDTFTIYENSLTYLISRRVAYFVVIIIVVDTESKKKRKMYENVVSIVFF